MEDQDTNELLIREFVQIDKDYRRARARHDAEVAAMLHRRREIVYLLRDNGLTHKEIGLLLGISAGRVGQLVKGASGYAPQRLSKDG